MRFCESLELIHRLTGGATLILAPQYRLPPTSGIILCGHAAIDAWHPRIPTSAAQLIRDPVHTGIPADNELKVVAGEG